jgi:hypothetical protein
MDTRISKNDLTDFPCELECRMEIINKVNKTFQFDTRTRCCAKTVIYVPTKVIRDGISVLLEDLFFHKTNKYCKLAYLGHILVLMDTPFIFW